MKTKRDFSGALTRYASHAGCSLRLFRKHLARSTPAVGPWLQALPAEITRLSPRVKGFRIRVSDGPIRVNNDVIAILDPAKRGFPAISFQARAGQLPVAVEVAAVKAVLHSS